MTMILYGYTGALFCLEVPNQLQNLLSKAQISETKTQKLKQNWTELKTVGYSSCESSRISTVPPAS